MHVGKFLNGYGRDAPPTGAARASTTGTAPSTPRPTATTATRSTRTACCAPTRACTRPTSSPPRARELIARPRRRGSRSSCRSRSWRPTAAPRASPTTRPASPTPAVAPRHANVFASTCRCRSRPRSTRSTCPTSRPRSQRPPADRGGSRRGDPARCTSSGSESLLAVDDGGRLDRRARCGRPASCDDTLILFTSDNGFFHGEHRVPHGKLLVYEPSIRLPLLMRGPGVPRGVTRAPARDQRRPGADDPRRGARHAGPRAGRALAARAGRATRASSGGGSCCSRAGNPAQGLTFSGAAQLPLEVRRARRPGRSSCTTSSATPTS